ncbi:MAG: invasion protein [Hyphomicrobiales bacterium]|nr:invasion protein [Hyphomicrobiales bacterium]
MSTFSLPLIGACFGLMLSASCAMAQAGPAKEPSVTTATYSDWTMRCVRDAAGASVCEVTQTLQMQAPGGTTPVAQIAIGRISPKAPLRLTVILPVNATFEKGPQMQVEEQPAQAAVLAWRRCANFGCVADLEVKTETLTLWRAAAKGGQLSFRNAGNQDVMFPFSFRGLGQALDAMPKG